MDEVSTSGHRRLSSNGRISSNGHCLGRDRLGTGNSSIRPPSSATVYSDSVGGGLFFRRRRTETPDSGRDGHFSAREAAALVDSWPHLQARGIGQLLVAAFAAVSPEQSSRLLVDDSVPTPTVDDPSVALLHGRGGRGGVRSMTSEAAAVEGLLAALVVASGSTEEEELVAERLRSLGPIHSRLGVVLSNGHWRELKRVLAGEVDSLALSGWPPETLSLAWNRLACFLIAKVKSGLH